MNVNNNKRTKHKKYKHRPFLKVKIVKWWPKKNNIKFQMQMSNLQNRTFIIKKKVVIQVKEISLIKNLRKILSRQKKYKKKVKKIVILLIELKMSYKIKGNKKK